MPPDFAVAAAFPAIVEWSQDPRPCLGEWFIVMQELSSDVEEVFRMLPGILASEGRAVLDGPGSDNSEGSGGFV